MMMLMPTISWKKYSSCGKRTSSSSDKLGSMCVDQKDVELSKVKLVIDRWGLL